MWPFAKHPPGTLRCSFCNKHQNDVRKLIAGPGVYICDECIALCNDIIAEALGKREEAQRNEEAGSGAALLDPPSHATPRVSPPALCRLCGLPAPIEQVVAVPDRGFLCLVCLDAIRAASEQDSKD